MNDFAERPHLNGEPLDFDVRLKFAQNIIPKFNSVLSELPESKDALESMRADDTRDRFEFEKDGYKFSVTHKPNYVVHGRSEELFQISKYRLNEEGFMDQESVTMTVADRPGRDGAAGLSYSKSRTPLLQPDNELVIDRAMNTDHTVDKIEEFLAVLKGEPASKKGDQLFPIRRAPATAAVIDAVVKPEAFFEGEIDRLVRENPEVLKFILAYSNVATSSRPFMEGALFTSKILDYLASYRGRSLPRVSESLIEAYGQDLRVQSKGLGIEQFKSKLADELRQDEPILDEMLEARMPDDKNDMYFGASLVYGLVRRAEEVSKLGNLYVENGDADIPGDEH